LTIAAAAISTEKLDSSCIKMTRSTSFFYLIVMLIVISTFSSISVQAKENKQCPLPESSVTVSVINTQAKVIYNTGYSRSDIERQQLKRGRHANKGKWKILGLTKTDFKYSLETSVKLTKTDGGRYCVYPVSFDLNIGYSDFNIYIDRKYLPGSCEYRAILKHENSHISIYRRYLEHYLPSIKKQLRVAASRVQTVIVSIPDQGTKYIQEQVQRRIRPLILKLNREADHSNARIDTPESYRKVQLLCDNW
jgi:hypothetical protein